MGIVKSLVGSIVGAAIALGIHYAIKQSTGESYVWFPLIIGLIVGILTRILAGNSLSTGSRVIAGGFAALIAGVAMFAPDIVNSLKAPTEFGPIAVKSRLVNASIAKHETEGSSDKKVEGSEDKGTGSGTTTAASTESPEPSDTELDKEVMSDSDGGEEAQPTNNSDAGSDAKTEKTERQMPAQTLTNDRSRGAASSATSGGAADEKFADLIKKSKHESWLETFLPIIFSGIGMVMAYVIGQSGVAPEPPKGAT